MLPGVPPAFRVEYLVARGPIRLASCAIHAATTADLEVELREQPAYLQRVRGRDDKVRRRDRVRRESPPVRLPKNRWTTHHESTSRELALLAGTVGSLSACVAPRAASPDVHRSAACQD